MLKSSDIKRLTVLKSDGHLLHTPIHLGGHELVFVQSLVPFVSVSALMIYKSRTDPNVFFFLKMHATEIDLDGNPTLEFTAFQTTRSYIVRLLESTVSITKLEKSAVAWFSILAIGDGANANHDHPQNWFAGSILGGDCQWTIEVTEPTVKGVMPEVARLSLDGAPKYIDLLNSYLNA